MKSRVDKTMAGTAFRSSRICASLSLRSACKEQAKERWSTFCEVEEHEFRM